MSPADLVRLFVRHRNAANLLMVVMLVAGAAALSKLNTQFFPDFEIDIVLVTVEWRGASAEDVEQGIVAAVEPEVRFLDNVKKVTGYAREGVGTVVVEFEQGADMQKALSDVDSAVAQVTTLPLDAEKPLVRNAARYDPIANIVISGPFSESALKAFAKRMRDDLLAAGIDRVTLFGSRDEEVWVELREESLRRLDLTLDTIAERISGVSQDLPSGTARGGIEKQVRTLGEREAAREFGSIEIKALEGGQKVLLRDVAEIREAFREDDPVGIRQGLRAIELKVQRSIAADALESSALLDDWLAENRSSFPPTLTIEVYGRAADLIRDRINVLLENGLGGLALVLIVLFVFLNMRVAFWVAAGIPVALMATMGVMYLTDQSINMISLFALIMVLGIIVDDAIVVGEHAQTLRERGMDALAAAEGGALRMLAPVAASSLTTIAAFLPLFVITDVIGAIMRAMPLVAVAVLVASLVECFLVLPGHLKGTFSRPARPDSRWRTAFNARFNAFRDGPFRAFVELCVRWRYVTVALALSSLILSLGLVQGGRIGFHFFPQPEADTVDGNIVMAPGTPRSVTARMVAELERAALAAEEELTGGDGELLVMTFGSVGRTQGRNFEQVSGDQFGGLTVELLPADLRAVRTGDFVAAWRARIRELPGTERVALNPRLGGPPGREIDIRLSGGTTTQLKSAALEIRDFLGTLPGLSDVEDDLPYGKQELVLEVTPRGRALGFDTQTVGRQVRNAFEGAIARRYARGDEEVSIRVRLPRSDVTLQALYDLTLRSPGGKEVPLSEVVELREDSGFARIRREAGQREVAVFAEIDETLTSLDQVVELASRTTLPEIAQRYGLSWRFAGKFEEQERTLGDIRFGAMIGLVAIYIILAWVFASYSRPLVVMAVIPFGVIGAILGHMALGFDLSVLSLIAVLGLSGILVNDSIILVSTVDELIDEGGEVMTAIVAGAQARLRAILLTSLSTIGGLTPLLFETSLQAQFLIPMAITIVFGLAVATLLVLIVVPALMAVQQDVGRLARQLWFGSRADRGVAQPTSEAP